MPYDLLMMHLKPATKMVMSETAASPLMCVNCNTVLSEKDAYNTIKDEDYNEFYYCSCGKASSLERLEVFILPTSMHLLDKKTAMDNIWFHATSREGWETKVKTPQNLDTVPYVHAGTMEAAMERFEDQRNSYGWIYELRLTSDCELADGVYADLNKWDYWVDEGIFEPEDIHENHHKHALRYVNRWEATGSISVLLDPRKMEVVAVHPIGAHPPTKAESKALAKELFPTA